MSRPKLPSALLVTRGMFRPGTTVVQVQAALKRHGLALVGMGLELYIVRTH